MSTDLQITQQENENRELLLTITVPESRVEQALRKEVRKLGRRLRVPGFRPGKAPYQIIIQRYGREALLEGIIDDLGQEVVSEALQSGEIEPYAQPLLEDVDLNPLTYYVRVPLEPEVDPGDYRSLRVAYEAVSDEAIQEETNKRLQEIRDAHKTWQPVERPIEYGDLVTTSLKVTVNDEVVLENDDWDFIPNEESYTLAPEFDAAFVGMEIGEKKSFSSDIPEDADSPWAGQTAHFEVEIKGIKAEIAPELDDDLAQEVSSYETAEELRNAVEESVREELTAKAEHDFSHKVMDTLREQSTLRYPSALLENQISLLIDEQENYYKQLGIESTEQLLKLTGKTMDAHREDLKPRARERLENELLLDAIVEREQFEISDYEAHQFLAEILAGNPEKQEEYSKLLDDEPSYRAYIKTLIKRDRASELIQKIAKGEEVPAPGEHPVLAPPEVADEESADEAPAGEPTPPSPDETPASSDDEETD